MSSAITPLNFAPPGMEREDLPDGSYLLRSTHDLGAYPDNICAYLDKWASQSPDRVFIADRLGEGRAWRKVTYRQARDRVVNLSQALLSLGVSVEAPLAILSDNSIENALLQLAAMYVGMPVVPISPAYSLVSTDHAKLKHIFSLVKPKVVFVQDGELFKNALKAVESGDLQVVAKSNVPREGRSFEPLLNTAAGEEVEQRNKQVSPDTIAKILFTSGSTGLPKGVINTQRMICSNQQMIAQYWPFLEEEPPVVLDWLPWNHTFGGNHNFNMILRNGGSLYVDDGKPTPALIERTVDNLNEVSPTLYFNVPVGFEMLASKLEADEGLRDLFFKNLKLIFYAAAALPQNTWERLEKLVLDSRGVRIPMVSAWGATETGPMVTTVHFSIDRAGVIGNPAPGTQVKMVPNGSKMEMRVKGPSITPGYIFDPDKTREAFDEEGFYLTGDAGELADPNNPSKGIKFAGRTAEDFKLKSGTWVAVGALRLKVIDAAKKVIQDAVIAGHDRDELGVLIFPNENGIRALCPPEMSAAPLSELIKRPEVVAELKKGLASHNQTNSAGSTRVPFALILTEPASIDANEITDKGYLNQRAVLERRQEAVQNLFTYGPGCIAIDGAYSGPTDNKN